MRRVIAWDSWAFLEVALDGDRAGEVASLAKDAHEIVTSRDILSETATFLSRRPRGTATALGWWDSIRESAIRVESPDLDDLRGSIPDRPLGNLSFADLSLAFVAKAHRTIEIASADHEFRALGLAPLFAPPQKVQGRTRRAR